MEQITGDVRISVSTFLQLVEGNKHKEEAYDKVTDVLERGLTEIVLSSIRMMKGNGFEGNLKVSEFDSKEIVREVVEENKIIHMILQNRDNDYELIITTGNREVK